MRHFDLTPLYRNTIGFDRLFSLLDQPGLTEVETYPPYNIERLDETGGAAVSERPFKGVDVRVSRYAYLVSLMPRQLIDELGLDGFDRRYLETIQRVFAGGPVGIEAIAHTMSSAADTLEDDVEPFLLRCELVVRTPRGRRLTPKGEDHLGAPPRIGPQARLF